MTALSIVSFLRPGISTNVLDMAIQYLDSKLTENREGRIARAPTTLTCLIWFLFNETLAQCKAIWG
jgi:hypothetical protein